MVLLKMTLMRSRGGGLEPGRGAAGDERYAAVSTGATLLDTDSSTSDMSVGFHIVSGSDIPAVFEEWSMCL